MRYVEIPRTGDTPFRFKGEILATQSSRRILGTEVTRWHELEAYRAEDDSYVFHVGWRTQWWGEADGDTAVLARSLAESEEFLRAAVAPCNPLAGYALAPRLEGRRDELERDAMVRFNTAVSKLLAKIKEPKRAPRAREARRLEPVEDPSLAEVS